MDQRRFLMQQNYATLFSLINKLQVEGDAALSELTSRQLMVIIAILHLPEDESTLMNISRKLGTKKQSTAQLIEILEKKGIIESKPGTKDKRTTNISIKPSAKPVIEKCVVEGMDFFENLFHEFTIEEMETLWSLLKKLYAFNGIPLDGYEAEGRKI